eukprot:g6273.t1
MLIILVVHPTVSGYAFNFFNCRFIEEANGKLDPGVNRTGNWYMTSDFSLKCYDDTYNRMAVLGWAVIILFSLGIPFAIVATLWKRRKKLEDTKTKRQLGMLYKSYKPQAYWFESVQMLFKLALYASLAFLHDDEQLKLAVALLTGFLQVAVHMRVEPFNTDAKNTMQAFSIFITFGVCFGAMVINYLRASQRTAYLLANEEQARSLEGRLEVVKTILSTFVWASLVGYAVYASFKAAKFIRKNRDRVKKGC